MADRSGLAIGRVYSVDRCRQSQRDGLGECQVLIQLGRLRPRQAEEFVAELANALGLGILVGLDRGVDPAVVLEVKRLGADLADAALRSLLGLFASDGRAGPGLLSRGHRIIVSARGQWS